MEKTIAVRVFWLASYHELLSLHMLLQLVQIQQYIQNIYYGGPSGRETRHKLLLLTVAGSVVLAEIQVIFGSACKGSIHLLYIMIILYLN